MAKSPPHDQRRAHREGRQIFQRRSPARTHLAPVIGKNNLTIDPTFIASLPDNPLLWPIHPALKANFNPG
jgi:hypothetical protein